MEAPCPHGARDDKERDEGIPPSGTRLEAPCPHGARDDKERDVGIPPSGTRLEAPCPHGARDDKERDVGIPPSGTRLEAPCPHGARGDKERDEGIPPPFSLFSEEVHRLRVPWIQIAVSWLGVILCVSLLPSQGSSPGQTGHTMVNSIGMTLAFIPAGTFLMGSPPEEKMRQEEELQHS